LQNTKLIYFLETAL